MIDLDLHRINFISVFVALDISKLDAYIDCSFLINVYVRVRIFKLKVIWHKVLVWGNLVKKYLEFSDLERHQLMFLL